MNNIDNSGLDEEYFQEYLTEYQNGEISLDEIESMISEIEGLIKASNGIFEDHARRLEKWLKDIENSWEWESNCNSVMVKVRNYINSDEHIKRPKRFRNKVFKKIKGLYSQSNNHSDLDFHFDESDYLLDLITEKALEVSDLMKKRDALKKVSEQIENGFEVGSNSNLKNKSTERLLITKWKEKGALNQIEKRDCVLELAGNLDITQEEAFDLAKDNDINFGAMTKYTSWKKNNSRLNKKKS